LEEKIIGKVQNSLKKKQGEGGEQEGGGREEILSCGSPILVSNKEEIFPLWKNAKKNNRGGITCLNITNTPRRELTLSGKSSRVCRSRENTETTKGGLHRNCLPVKVCI